MNAVKFILGWIIWGIGSWYFYGEFVSHKIWMILSGPLIPFYHLWIIVAKFFIDSLWTDLGLTIPK